MNRSVFFAMRKLLFLVNPNAGQRRVNKSLTEIIGIFNEGGYEVTVFLTNGPGSGTQIVQERAADYDLVVCAGGDGTLNETVTGVLRSGGDVTWSTVLDVCPQWLACIPLTALVALVLQAGPWPIAISIQVVGMIKVPLCIWRIGGGKWIHDVTKGRDA